MNLQYFTSELPKAYLRINAHEINSDSSSVQHITTNDVTLPDGSEFSSGQLKLEQTLINPIPAAGSVVISAPVAQDGRILVSSDNLGAQIVAFKGDPVVVSELISNDTFSRVNCNDGDNITASINGVNKIEIDDVKTTISSTNSRLNLASLSSGIDADNTTFFSASNVGNTENMSIVVLPNQTMIYQDSGTIQRMVVDDNVTLNTKNYGLSGSQLQLTDAGFMTLRDGNGDILIEMDSGLKEIKTRAGPITPVETRIVDGGISYDMFTNVGPNAGQMQNRFNMTSVDTRFRNVDNEPCIQFSQAGVMIGNNAYTLPFNPPPVAGQYIESTGVVLPNLSIETVWMTPPPKFSSYAKKIVTGVARQSLLSASIYSSTTIAANTFTAGSVWRLSAYGIYNVAPAQTIVLSILMNGIAVAFTPALAIANSPSPWSSSWLMTVQTVGGAGIGKLASGSTNRLDSSVICSNTVDNANFNTTVANVIDFACTLSLAGDNITCESVSFSRVV